MKVKRGYYDVFVRTCAKYPSNIAIRHYTDNGYKTYTYSELYGGCEYISQILQQFNCSKGVIGLVSDRTVLVPCVIAAAHKCCTIFMFLGPSQDIQPMTKNIKFTVIITINKNLDDTNTELLGKKPDRTVNIFDLAINFFYQESTDHHCNKYVQQHSYIAMTSGSTGEPKHIQVPIQSLQPNIDDLTKMFDITPQDIIYFSTPLTFDPSMVEILLACMNGASLLIAPDKADILFPGDKQHSITFWQTTPSKFYQYSNVDIKNKILSSNSTLKILALGGEPLNGLKRIKELKDLHNKTKIYTLYGVTEMSCWACAAEVDLNRMSTEREVPLGTCLSETQLVVEPVDASNTGNIILVSETRKCYVLNKTNGTEELKSLKHVDTGDIGEVKSGTVYYRGRKDDIIKRFGYKINLQLIESTIMLCPRVKTCSCVWLPTPMLLVIYFSSETLSSQELLNFLKCKLDDKHWPDKVVRVDNLPTNPHGKVSKQILTKMYEKSVTLPQTIDSLKVTFVKEMKRTLGRNFTYDEIKARDFFSIGGTSFLAVSMCNKLSLTCPQFGQLILPYLISNKHNIEEIIEIAQKEISPENTRSKRRMKRCKSLTESSISQKKASTESSVNPVEFICLWTYDTGKCVDASPTLFLNGHNLYVTVGSHSGKVIVMDASSGDLQGSIKIKSRVEASVLCYHEHPVTTPCGVVGAYDGTIVCFILETCTELWRINIGSMIKSKAACCNGTLYIAAYDGKIRCIDILTGEIKDTINISEQAISADLVIAKRKYVLLGTLSGVCASIIVGTNTVVWRGTLNSPVFASPVLYDDDKYVVFAEVNGEIHCRTVEKGIKIWKYQGAKGNIFSSLYIKEVDKLKWQMVFGCHDSNVYSIYIKNFQPSLHWKAQLTSPVYSTPCRLSDKFILAASNSGKLCVINSGNGMILAEHQLPNETFSSPVVYGDYIFIGCRNDLLYSLKYVLDL